MSKMDELKAAVATIREVLGYSIDKIDIRVKPTGEDAATELPNGATTHGMYFTKQAADKADARMKNIGLSHSFTCDLQNGANSQEYSIDDIKVKVWHCPDPEDRIAALEAELAKLRGEEASVQ